MDAVAALVGGAPASTAFVDRTGTVVIREDGEWCATQPARDKWLAGATALPLLWHYWYPLRPGAAAQRLQGTS